MIRYKNLNISDIRLGNQILSKIYKGDLLIFLKNNTVVEPDPPVVTDPTLSYTYCILEGLGSYSSFDLDNNITCDGNKTRRAGPYGSGTPKTFKVYYDEDYTDLYISYYNMVELTKITDINKLKRLRISSGKVEYINLTNINTTNFTDMSYMFNCSNLLEIDLSNFNTSNVTTMDSMFRDCKSLSTIDVSNFDTSKCKNMSRMFLLCKSLSTIDVSNFNTSLVSSFDYMFSSCENLIELNLTNFIAKWTILTLSLSFSLMFHGCTNLTRLYIPNFDVTKLSYLTIDRFDNPIYHMFTNCTNLKYILCKQTVYDALINVPDISGISDTKMLTSEGVWDIVP